jgi:hypothetical protein
MTERRKPDAAEPADAPADLPPLEAEDERALEDALAAAFRPAEIDAARLERIVDAALEDPFAPPTDDEIVESDRLRRALEGEGSHPEAALAEALRAAARAHEDAPVERALARAKGGGASGGRGNVVYAAFGGAGVALALAAMVAFWVAPSSRRSAPADPVAAASSTGGASALARSRSTAPLFEQPFQTRSTSARMDRISAARGRELRENRYALWGVR